VIPGGVLKLKDGTFEVWCHTQDSHERCGVYKTLARAKREWVKAEIAYNHRRNIKPSDAPVYEVVSRTVVEQYAVRMR
jgi:hypothetical protein